LISYKNSEITEFISGPHVLGIYQSDIHENELQNVYGY